MIAERTPKMVQRDWLRALEKTARIEQQPQRIFPAVIDELADRQGDAVALRSEREQLSFRELADLSGRYAHWALTQGVKPGDRVALLMPNRAAYVAIWLGITRLGGVVALLNTNLRGPALAHCLDAAAPGHAIVDASLADAMTSALPHSRRHCRCWVHADVTGGVAGDFEPIAAALADAPPVAPVQAASISDPALMIYTSGTTGLPKAAYVGHRRIMQWSHWFAGLMDMQPSDRVYNCLPLYHSVGGVVAVGAALAGGASVVVRERFSASRFWADIAEADCTIFQYIGELCRYLVNAPTSEAETRHRLRLACGNGLAADVWEKFERRFSIPRILEFYAATEGNFSLYNCEGKRGAIGRVPPFLAHRSTIALVAVDDDTGAPARGPDGLCVRRATGETGEAVGEMRGGIGRFEGYTDAAASEKKVLRDVFAKGDTWIRSGDLMRQDEAGFFYFVDRAGDTFRWKGENVATTEVAAALAAYPGVLEATVYGVAVGGAEGRAGMAALVVDGTFRIDGLAVHLSRRLPEYACPLFVRISQQLEITATFRPKKHDLAREGFDPGVVGDPIHFRDAARRSYVRLDGDLYGRIQAGDVRV